MRNCIEPASEQSVLSALYGITQTELSSSATAVRGCVVADAVEAERFAGEMQAGDLLAAVVARRDGFQRLRAHRVQVVECVAFAEQRFATLDGRAAQMTDSRRLSAGARPAGAAWRTTSSARPGEGFQLPA